MKVTPLGAGQDVGRSCLLLTIGSRNVMLDCGMHMGYHDHRRFPDFKYLGKDASSLDCIIISHFHLDHCGALPYFTEVFGFDGPIFMTHPTRAIAPLLLEDMRRVMELRGERLFSKNDIINCMKKVKTVDLLEEYAFDVDLKLKPYYAGHVLGAAMFHITATTILGSVETCVYTGDYNMTPDRHLGYTRLISSAWIDDCKPDLLITESTYATTVRSSRKAREGDFLKKVHDAVLAGGKVLIPVFALGRAQELLLLIDSYWGRMVELKDIPIYFSAGLTEKANDYYKLYVQWTNEGIKERFVHENPFNFPRITAWKPEYVDKPGPMVLFASPGMLHAGTSLLIFTKWCHDPKNVVIMPGYCVAGTVGAKVLAGERKIDIDRFKSVQVNMQVQNLSFSAHADAKGILNLISMCAAKNVMLVHGERVKMEVLKAKIITELGIPCFNPANGETTTIVTCNDVPALVQGELPSAGRLMVPKDTINGKLQIIELDPDRFSPINAREYKTLDLKFKSPFSVEEIHKHLAKTVPSIKFVQKKDLVLGPDFHIKVGDSISVVYSDGYDGQLIKVLAALNQIR